ncbi:putative hydrolase [Gordonia polyisoprenivorans NBRC 16320 = JCM 10675]|uniref:NUDIX hydrolase n=1 Tax=Gordonia polyisoprenivorans TaxID=84595 RepID=A0A846WUC0_9ACTN|nr:NUDIX hydrolase [Gordonia polyisoprenivorans]NKY05279.1 NUDIX hydrolase [Gordonia polyisoprenivorans]GAB21869.1 putative hydrolase [Gordonia polyisoprenivorans NBRC 16320 = JCM 10675]
MAQPEPGILSVVSVDVVALTYDAEARAVLVATHRRTTEPHLGERALPGVVVRSGERLTDAASRALTKLGIDEPPSAIGQLKTFDEPSRDPRGPSLSVAMWATFWDSADIRTEQAVWTPIDRDHPPAFDHAEIITAARSILAEKLWRDLGFTRGLTGPQFTATDAVTITRSLTGAEVHRANLNRDLARITTLTEAGVAPAAGGRPPKIWRWSPIPTDSP